MARLVFRRWVIYLKRGIYVQETSLPSQKTLSFLLETLIRLESMDLPVFIDNRASELYSVHNTI
jgi:hypothetical protein